MKNEVIPKGEMTEKNLFKTAKIFWPKGEWETQVRYYYDPSNRRKFYLVDCCSKKKKIEFSAFPQPAVFGKTTGCGNPYEIDVINPHENLRKIHRPGCGGCRS